MNWLLSWRHDQETENKRRLRSLTGCVHCCLHSTEICSVLRAAVAQDHRHLSPFSAPTGQVLSFRPSPRHIIGTDLDAYVRTTAKGILQQLQSVDWVHLAEDRNQWRALADTVINLFSIKGREFIDQLLDRLPKDEHTPSIFRNFPENGSTVFL